MNNLLQDLRYAFRQLNKNRGFTAVAILTLALGIGANTAIVSFLDAIMFQSVPVHDPSYLVVFQWAAHKQPGGEYSSFSDCAAEGDQQPFGCSFSYFAPYLTS